MPRGRPRLGLPHLPTSGATLPSGAPLPQPEVLGTVKESVLREDVAASATWVSPNGEVVTIETAPPWAKLAVGSRNPSDARTFVDVPDDWVLRWMDKKRLEARGWQYWMPVTTTTPGVKLKVAAMRASDNTIRRGYEGDILAFMPRSWFEQRIKDKEAEVARKTAGVAQESQQFVENANRGKYGPHVRGGWDNNDAGKIPVKTQFVAGSGEHPA